MKDGEEDATVAGRHEHIRGGPDFFDYWKLQAPKKSERHASHTGQQKPIHFRLFFE